MFNKYFERGLSIIPVKKNDKMPIIEGWSRYCDVLPTALEVEAWESRYAGCNVGLCLGPSSGICALDLDTDRKDIFDICKSSPVVKVGNAPRETRFFRAGPGIETCDISISKTNKEQVQILYTGRQTVIPPSIHPTTKRPYYWLTPDTLENFDIKDLPILTLEDVDKIRDYIESKYNDDRTCGNASGRNTKLVQMVTGMRADGKSEEQIIKEIYEWDLNNHSPRLFTDPLEGKRAANESEALRNVWKFVSSVTVSIYKLKNIPVPSENIKIIDTEKIKKKEIILKDYPEPRGIMKDFVDICEMTSKGSQDALGLGGALALMSALCANRFKTQVRGLDVWPNLYIINLAYSSFGKETPQRLIGELLSNTNLIGSSLYRSGTSIVMNLPEQQERLDLLDECSGILRDMNSTDGYKSELVEILSSLYSKSSSKYIGITSLNKGERFGACWNPCVTLLGSTTPSGFRSSVNKDMAAKGLMPRFLVFYQSKIGQYKGRIKIENLSDRMDSLKSNIEKILSVEKNIHHEFNLGKNYLSSRQGKSNEDLSKGYRYDPLLIPCTEKAHALWIDYEEKMHNESSKNPEDFDSAFMGRLAELCIKNAISDAVSLFRKTIDVDSIVWAKDVVETQWHNVKALYELAAAENKQESATLRVLTLIKEQGVIKKSEVVRKTQWLKKNEREDILKSLEDSNQITKGQEKSTGSGPRAIYYKYENSQEFVI